MYNPFNIEIANMQFKKSMSDYDYYANRFLKYKLKEKQVLNCAIVAETWDNPAQQRMYNYSSNFYERAINVPTNFIHVNYVDIRDVSKASSFNVHESHMVLLPTEVSLFEDSKYFNPGPIYHTTETIILSAIPKHTISTSLSFLNMEAQVMVHLLLALLSVALTLTLVKILRNSRKNLSFSKSFEVVVLNCTQQIWNSSSIFCSEPYPFIPRIVSARIATMGWLLGVTLFVSVVNCVMKSDFSEERYQYLDDLETLMKNEEIKAVVIEDGFTHLFLQIASKRNKKIRKYLSKFDEDNFCSVLDLMNLEFYEEILKGKKALIINRLLLTWFLGFELSTDLREMRNLKAKYGGFYISKQRVKSDFLVFLFNKTFSKESPIVYEQECLGLLAMFETSVYHYLDLNSEFALRFMEWKKPTKATDSLNPSAMTGPFFVFICGLIFATATFAIEVTLLAIVLVWKRKPAPRCITDELR